MAAISAQTTQPLDTKSVVVQRLSGNFRKLLARVSVARSNQGALSDTESSAAYVLPAGLPPGPGVPPELNPVTPVDVPEAGLPPVPTEPPGLNPVTPVFEPAAGEVPDGTFADAAGAAGAGAGRRSGCRRGGGWRRGVRGSRCGSKRRGSNRDGRHGQSCTSSRRDGGFAHDLDSFPHVAVVTRLL